MGSRTLSSRRPERGGSAPVRCCMPPRRLRTATGSSGALHTPPPPLHMMWASLQGVPEGLSGDLPAVSTGIRFSRRGGRCPQDAPTPITPPFADSSAPLPPQFDPLSFLRSGPCHSSLQDWEQTCQVQWGVRGAGGQGWIQSSKNERSRKQREHFTYIIPAPEY